MVASKVFNDVCEVLKALAAEGALPASFGSRPFDETTPLAELGLDSLARLMVLQEIEQRLDIDLRDVRLAALKTLGDLVTAVEAARTLPLGQVGS